MAKEKQQNENPNTGQSAEQPAETPVVPAESTGTGDANDANAPVQPSDPAGEVTATGTTDESPMANVTEGPNGVEQSPTDTPSEEPEVNPNTGENDDERLKRGVEGEPIATKPVEEVVQEVKASYDLNFDVVKGDISTVQKICDAHAVEFNLNLYANTATVTVPEGSTFPSEALAPYC